MSLSLLLLFVIWALPCPMACLPAVPAGVGVDLLLLLQRSLAAALAIATAASEGYPGVPLSSHFSSISSNLPLSFVVVAYSRRSSIARRWSVTSSMVRMDKSSIVSLKMYLRVVITLLALFLGSLLASAKSHQLLI